MLLAIGFCGMAFLGMIWCFTNILGADFAPIGTRPLLAYSAAAAVLGAQALSLGMLAELLVAYTGKESDTYSICATLPAGRSETIEPGG